MTHPECFEDDMESLEKISELLPDTEVPFAVKYGELKLEKAQTKAEKNYIKITKELDKIISCNIKHCLEDIKGKT